MCLEYGQEIIVGVRFRDTFTWYASEKELWFLDYRKWSRAFVEAGCIDEFLAEENFSDRFNIAVVDGDTASPFLANMTRYQMSASDLQELLTEILPASCRDEIIHLMPSLFVDFDCRFFASFFYEPASFEDYVPAGWVSEYIDLRHLIPEDQRYWIVNGVDLFDQLSE